MTAPEQSALQNIDHMLEAADWIIQDMKTLNPGASVGIAVREYPKSTGVETRFIHEAQRIDSIGLVVKMLVDKYPEIQILVTGSSALELASGLYESMTGRASSKAIRKRWSAI